MDQNLLQSYLDSFLIKEIRHSKKELYNAGKSRPKIFFVLYDAANPEQPFHSMPIPGAAIFFSTPEAKDRLKGYIQHFYNTFRSVVTSEELAALIVIADAFVSEHPIPENGKVNMDNYPMPSKDPNRQECLLVSIETKEDKWCLCQMHTYTRINRKVVFDNSAHELPAMQEGRFYNLFPENAK